MDQNGLPTIAIGTGIFADADAQNRLKQVESPEVSFAALIDGVLREAEGAVNIVIDPQNRKVYAADHATDKTALAIACVSGGAKSTAITPEADQTGRSLTWEDPVPEADFDAAVQAAALAVVEPVRPARSVASLVSALLGNLPEDKWPLVKLDQDTGTVSLVMPTTRATAVAALEALTLNTGNGVKVTLTEPAAEGEAEPLIFEGGSTGA